MNQAEQKARTTPMEAAAKAIFSLQKQINEQGKRITELETCATLNAETIGYVAELRHTVAEQNERIAKLEVVLREAAPWLALLSAARDI